MDMRSLEHCLNDITNTAGVQSDLKGEFSSSHCNLVVIEIVAFVHQRPGNPNCEEARAESLLDSVYMRLDQSLGLMRLQSLKRYQNFQLVHDMLATKTLPVCCSTHSSYIQAA